MHYKLDYIKSFIEKHNFNPNIEVKSVYPHNWEDVIGVVIYTNDNQSKMEISFNDIQYDIDSDMPDDAFNQWIEYCNSNKQISYFEWVSVVPNYYEPKCVDNSESLKMKSDIENVLDIINNSLNKKESEE